MNAESRFNYLVGGLALLSAMFSMLWFSHNFRPSVLVKQLDELLHDTTSLYDSYVAEGVLDNQELREGIRRELLKLKRSANAAREETYKIKTTAGEYWALFRGEWKNIRVVSARIVDFRAELIRTSQEVRKNRGASGAENAQNVCPVSPPECISHESTFSEVSSSSTSTNAASNAPTCTPPLPLSQDLDTDSISLAPTLVYYNRWSHFRRVWSAMTVWRTFHAQSEAAPADIERGVRDLASSS